MAMVESSAYVEQVGETAGLVWHTLHEMGPLPLTKLVKLIDAPRDVVMQALGWLAREDKLVVEEGRTRLFSVAP